MTVVPGAMPAEHIKRAIEARLEELRPFVTEYERLKGAELVLSRIPKSVHQIRQERPPRKPAAIVGNKPPQPRYTHGEKLAAIKQARKTSVKESSRTYGIPEATIYRWIRAASQPNWGVSLADA